MKRSLASLVGAISLALIVFSVGYPAFRHWGTIQSFGGGETPTTITCVQRPTWTSDPRPTTTRDPFPKSPTPAPRLPTPGSPPPPQTAVPRPTLTVKLDTVENVLNYLLKLETSAGTVWDEPWCLETLYLDPGRIQVKWYPWRGFDGGGYGYDSPNGPTVVISIKGWVSLGGFRGPGWGRGKTNGVTFEFSRDTGDLWGISGGSSLKSGAKDLPDAVTIAPTKKPPSLTRTPGLRRRTETPVPITREP